VNYSDYTLVEFDSLIASNSEEMYKYSHSLINRAADVAFCIDENARFLYVNQMTCSTTEYSRNELMSMTIKDIDIEFSEETWSQKWQALKENQSCFFSSHYRTKTDRIFSVEVKISYVEHEGVGFGCVFVGAAKNELTSLNHKNGGQAEFNINEVSAQVSSEYKKGEAKLEESLSVLRSTLESTANGILAVNFEGEILCYNQKFMDMWNLPREVQITKGCDRARAFFESQVKEPELFRCAVWEMPSETESESYDLVELKDGRIFAHYSEPYRLGNKIIGRVWSICDITESKRTEAALKLNESRFRTLAETTEATIFLVQDTHICYVNPAAETLTGYTRKELTSQLSLDNLIKCRRVRQVSQNNGNNSCEYQEIQIITKNGSLRWLACTVATLNGMFDFGYQSVQLVTAIDITDYKQAESELFQALEQAKRLSELRERFVSMLCHQFRTPLNVVSFSADLLRRHIHQWTEEKNRSYLDLIQSAVKEISHLLDDILLFGKAESAKLEFQPRRIDVESFCRDILVQIQLASGNQKSINFICRGHTTAAYLDPKLLQHILNNLLSNAIKYSPISSVVNLEVDYQHENIVFRVKDAGIGIPVVDQEDIFEPFYRGSNVENIAGTGLGLAIVKMLVELHQGQVLIESEAGFGTIFTIILPNMVLNE
jgi:PAS domain S-box-containing protein